MEKLLLRLELIGHSWNLVPREVQVSSLPTNHFPIHEKHSGNILLSKCPLSWPCRESLGFSTLGIKSLIIEYLSLGKPSLARAALNQFIVPRGRCLKKRTTRCHHRESRALRFIQKKGTITMFQPLVTNYQHRDLLSHFNT